MVKRDLEVLFSALMAKEAAAEVHNSVDTRYPTASVQPLGNFN